LQSAPQNDESLAANLAHKAQMSAQSRQSAIHFKWFLSFKLMQQVAHSSHSKAQARQASMQFLEFFILFNYLIFSSVPLLSEYFE
jgi:Rps23 Pro-64 3,4-dihydroxylase Tpa1-like proline 4-hydroxylase